MFSRWRQENYFRYGRMHFALDALDTYLVHPDDPERLVPNPERAKLDRQLSKAIDRHLDLEDAHTAGHLDDPELASLIEALDAELDTLIAKRERTPERVPLGQLAPDAKLLDSETKLLTHAVRMSVYNAESALVRLLAPHYRQDEARALLREAVRSSGDLQIVGKTIHVRINPLSAPRRTRALEPVCRALNATETRYPGTDLKLLFEFKEAAGLA